MVVDTRLVGQTVRSGGVLRGRCRLRRGRRATVTRGDGGEVRRGARLRPRPRRPREDLRRALAARDAGDRSRTGPAPACPGTWTPWQVGVTADACSWSACSCDAELLDPRRFRAGDAWRLRVGAPGRDGHRRPRRTSRLRARRGRGRRRGAALRPGPAQHPARSRFRAGPRSPGVVGLGRPGRACSWRSPSDWPSGPPTTGCSTPPRCPRRRREAPREAGRPPAAREAGGSRAASGRPFRSLLAAQVIGAVLGLVFWVLTPGWSTPTRSASPPPRSALQTLLGIVTVLGIGTVLISDLPLASRPAAPARPARAAGGAGVVGPAGRACWWPSARCSPRNLKEALGNPIGAAAFVVGVVAAAWAIVADEAALGVRRSTVQVHRNLLASSLRFPITAALLALGLTDAHVLQVCWVLPLVLSVPFALWRLQLPRRARRHTGIPPLRDDVVAYRRTRPAQPRPEPVVGLSVTDGSCDRGVTLASVANAEFAIAWLMATFVFLPPYLLAIALFAHGANVSTEEFRKSMEKTLPASLLLSALLCVGAWVFGEPVLLIFGGDYAVRVVVDPGAARARRAVDVLQGPPRGPVALAAALRPGDQAGRRGAADRDRRRHDRRRRRRRRRSLRRAG